MATCARVDAAGETRRWRLETRGRWNSSIAHHARIHPRLFVGSRLSVARLRQGLPVVDQHGAAHRRDAFFLVCVAGDSVCRYAQCDPRAQAFHMRDRVYDECGDVLRRAEPAAELVWERLRRSNVLVHCHAGQNRAALVVAVMAARHGLASSFDDLASIMREDNAKRGIDRSLVNFTMHSCLRPYWVAAAAEAAARARRQRRRRALARQAAAAAATIARHLAPHGTRSSVRSSIARSNTPMT